MPYHKQLAKDKIIKNLIKEQGAFEIKKKNNILLAMCSSVISQQLSTKVADVIFNRFLALFETKNPKAIDIAAIPLEELRRIGLSNAKANYIKNVCGFFVANKLTDAKLHKMSNAELIDLLTQIKGIGQWTVEMILMFTLAREDVFSSGDYGIQKAMVKLYNIEYSNKKELLQKMMAISEFWIPYRSYACLHLWKHLNNK